MTALTQLSKNVVWSLLTVRATVVAMVVVVQTISAGMLYADERKLDWDIRCCLEERDLNVPFRFIIELAGVDRPVGHLSILTPTGKSIGFEASSQTFSHITMKEGVYALGPRPQSSIDAPTWNHIRYALLYRDGMEPPRLEKGRYMVRVVGLWSGRYILRFYPIGRQNGVAAEFGTGGGIPIKAGETHEYVFDGERVQAPPEKAESKLQPLEVKRIR